MRKTGRYSVLLCTLAVLIGLALAPPLALAQVPAPPAAQTTEPLGPGPTIQPAPPAPESLDRRIDSVVKPAVDALARVFFWDPLAAFGVYDPVMHDESGAPVLGPDGKPITRSVPLIVLWLVFGAIFFTIRMGFINVRAFRHALDLVRGRYSDPNEPGEVSHFKALTTALSATVGLGNIAGVAVAISAGGPGATLWMIVAGLLGMTSKFTECTLGVKYRKVDASGHVSGGPMYYLSRGLAVRQKGGLGKVLAVVFSVLCIGGSFGGGNMFQSNQAFLGLKSMFPGAASYGWLFGVVLAVLVGLVILGGIQSIANITSLIVPVMCGTYIAAALAVLALNAALIPAAFGAIFSGAFAPEALYGGMLGVLVQGFRRAAFSNEAGIGSAAIAHSAAKTKEPVSEGIVALLEPFIDTVVVCTMTALVIVVSGAYQTTGLDGTALSFKAFGSTIRWFPYVLTLAVLLFAYSTMISWSYYGLKAWTYLLGDGKAQELSYKIIFCMFVVVGAASSLGAVIDFSDMMILGMAFPNILGLLLLSGEVRKDLDGYLERLRSGVIRRFDPAAPEKGAVEPS